MLQRRSSLNTLSYFLTRIAPVKLPTFQSVKCPFASFTCCVHRPGDAPFAWNGIHVPHLFTNMTPTCILTFIVLLYEIFLSGLQMAYIVLYKSAKTFTSSFFCQ